MKRFTQKFFLLAIGMILSVGASAQGDGIKHRFPQLDYTSSDGKTKAFIPAWDVQMYNEGVIPGCIRLQITEVVNLDSENPANNVFKCKIVNRLGNLSDLSNFHYTTSGTSVSFINKDGTKVTKTAGTVKYSDFIDIDTYDTGTWFEGTDYDHSDYQVFNFKTNGRHYVYGDFVIPEKYVNSKYGEFQITDIDMFAFRNNSVNTTATEYWFRPTSVTIPATIKSIGLGAFLNNRTTTKVTIASNSEISEISPRAFMNMGSLEEINLPASVTTIGGAALGGCTNLKKITFEGATPPTTFGTILWTPSNQPAVTCDWLMANSTSFGNITPANCIIEVPLHSAKNYVNANNRFTEFPMSSKFELKKDIVTYCSDLPFTFKQYNTSDGTWSDGSVKVYYVDPDDVGVILAIALMRKLFVKDSDLAARRQHPEKETYIARFNAVNPAINGKTIAEIVQMTHFKYIVSRMWRKGEVIVPKSSSVIMLGDRLMVVTTRDEADSLELLFGERIKDENWNREEVDWNAIDSKVESRVIVLTRPLLNGKLLGDLQLRKLYKVNVSDTSILLHL